MKKFFAFITLISTFFVNAQQDRVTWDTSVEKISETEYTLKIKASIEEGWHLYSQHLPEGGAIPTSFSFEGAGETFELIGTVKESEPHTEHDKVFDMELSFFDNYATFEQKIKLKDSTLTSIVGGVDYQACDDRSCIFRSAELDFSLDGSEVIKEEVALTDKDKALSDALKLPIKNPELLVDADQAEAKKKGLWGFIFIGFLGGLIALLMPCTFPMIPLTVSFFTKQSKTKAQGIKNAIIYGLSIIVISVLISGPFHLFDSLDENILNTISTSAWLNVALFAIFIFFALSLFGFYELTLPNSWSNKMDAASNRGGLLGIFFMAFTLVLVSFSCTGPILGGLLAGTATSEGNIAMNLTVAMLGFGIAFALPFTMFALFPSWLNSLPKSGGWMNTVKVVLGFIELAFAFKFLSNADLVQHWGFLKREIFVGIWIVIFVAQILYLFGKIKFPHDGPLKKLSFGRISFAVLTLAFVIYLIPGVTNSKKNLTGLSGILPPEFYSVYPQENDCPLGLDCYKDFEEGLEVAKAKNKPILLDFTGWACQNCRRMEENVWVKNEVYNSIKDDYVLISLYIDDRKELAQDERFNFKYESGRVKNISTVGEKWGTFQAINFKSASQPYYILMSPDYKLLQAPQQYTDVDTYSAWLKNGLSTFKKSEEAASIFSN